MVLLMLGYGRPILVDRDLVIADRVALVGKRSRREEKKQSGCEERDAPKFHDELLAAIFTSIRNSGNK